MDTMVKIAVCDKRTDKRYRNQNWKWSALKEKNRAVFRTTVSVAEYQNLPKAKKDELKDHGGFVGGALKEGTRKNGYVLGRQVGCLDADNIPGKMDFISLVRKALPETEWFIYSTHKHTTAAPRYRVVILLDREVREDEYPPIMMQVAKDIGLEYFDNSTYEACRMMYWSSCPADGTFVFEENSGAPLDTAKYLGRYADWRDVAEWPVSARQTETVRNELSKQEDPLEKQGVIGAFCRTYYPIQKAMRTFLSKVYAPTDSDRRWGYIPAESTAGVVIYDNKFAYSHHTTDPACGKLLNAYDLVRVHLFGDEGRESASKMNAFAVGLDEIKMALDREKQEKNGKGFTVHEAQDREWVRELRYKPKSRELENSSWNLMTIFEHDPDLQGFAMNEMAGRVQIVGATPWSRPDNNRFWRDADSAQLKVLLDNRYTVFPDRALDACFLKTAEDRRFHPVRDYLTGLPAWDGVPRIETLFQECLQADDTPYVRAVGRKTFAEAVARILEPGIKFDSVPVLDGVQGIGKSSFFRELCGSIYYNETLSLTDISDKSGAEKLQGFWIVEIGELAGMRKADVEKVKAFLSTCDDQYRPSYGKTVESHLRQCIIIATVNGDRGYLRDITGNRRFWVVKCRQTEQRKKFSFTQEDRDRIWAEAVAIWKNGEKLYLEDDLLKEAESVQRTAMEEDDRQGMVEEYLETMLPEDWDEMELFDRRNYLRKTEGKNGTVRRETVSNIEIWSECFGNDPSDMSGKDTLGITAIMVRIGGWNKSEKRIRTRLYGQQRVFVREV